VVLLSLLLDTDLSDPWELDRPLMEPDGPSQPEAVSDTSPLKARKSYLLPRLESSIEVLERLMEVSQCLLGRTLRGFVHPWELVFFQRVEELVLLNGVSEPVVTLIVLVLFDPLVESPIVGKTSYSCMLSKG